MATIYSLKKGVLLASVVLVALMLWLSISFLVVAVSEKRDTRFLEQYVSTDKILRGASIALAEERAASYRLMGLRNIADPVLTLENVRLKTDAAINGLNQQYQKISALPGYTEHLKFRKSEVTELFDAIQASLERLKNQRVSFGQSFELPLSDRSDHLAAGVLDHYNGLIEQIELFRYATAYVSRSQSRITNNLFSVSDATWNILLSNHMLTALFEGYLFSGGMADGGAIDRADRHVRELKRNIKKIRQIDSYSSVDAELNTLAADLDAWYTSSYEKPVIDVFSAMSENKLAPFGYFEWRRIRRQMTDLSGSLLDRIDGITYESIEKVSNRARNNFLIDCFLVFLGLMLVLFSLVIASRVRYQATHDALTGLSNRKQFADKCEQYIDSNTDSCVSLIKVDLSKFKSINDRFGQFVGDKVLQQVANKLQSTIDPAHTVARLDGDEFAVLLEDCCSVKTNQIANNVAQTVSGYYKIGGQSMHIKTSVGYACSPEDGKTADTLVKAADLALSESKQAGSDTVVPYNAQIADAYNKRQEMETELGFALERNEFELHYQPQFDVEKQMVDGVEALIRWRHPSKGLVSPFHFIPVAEDAGMLPAIGEWVIKEAIRQSVAWKKEENLHLRVSVNVSAHQFADSDVVNIIKTELARSELDPRGFEIEITESVAMTDVDTVIEKLSELHDTGIRIALDDFGTGYSSLSYLRDLPLDTLKIDRSFVMDIDDGSESQKLLLETIASMAKRLDLHTVAEGVETDSQLSQVCALGVDTIQGYYYSKPVAAADLPGDVKAIDAKFAVPKAA